MAGASLASSKSSGRIPTTTSAVSLTPFGAGTFANGRCTVPPLIFAEKKFIAGEPMKPATKMFTGSL